LPGYQDSPRMNRMLRKALATAILLVVLGAGRAGAAAPEIRRSGRCDGSSTSVLGVTRYDATRLRVRFAIANSTPGQTWQLFGSDNGIGIFVVNRVVSASGSVSVRRLVKDLPGKDIVTATGFNPAALESCKLSLGF
jgi:hypothetical protein